VNEEKSHGNMSVPVWMDAWVTELSLPGISMLELAPGSHLLPDRACFPGTWKIPYSSLSFCLPNGLQTFPLSIHLQLTFKAELFIIK
jgi:hypothetical protein